jgi:hypothetical protein
MKVEDFHRLVVLQQTQETVKQIVKHKEMHRTGLNLGQLKSPEAKT